MARKRTAYDALGLRPDADAQQIRLAFRTLAKMYHPDVNNGDARAEKEFRRMTAAHDILKNPQRRAAYDASLRVARKAAARRRMGFIVNCVLSATASFCIVSAGLLLLPNWPGTGPAIVAQADKANLANPFGPKFLFQRPSIVASANSADVARPQPPQVHPSADSKSASERPAPEKQIRRKDVRHSGERVARAESSGRERGSSAILAHVLAHAIVPDASHAAAVHHQQHSRSRDSRALHPLASAGGAGIVPGGDEPPAPLAAVASVAEPGTTTTVQARSPAKQVHPGTSRRHAAPVATGARDESRAAESVQNDGARTRSSELRQKQRLLHRNAHRRLKHEHHPVTACAAPARDPGSVRVLDFVEQQQNCVRGRRAELERPARNFGTD